MRTDVKRLRRNTTMNKQQAFAAFSRRSIDSTLLGSWRATVTGGTVFVKMPSTGKDTVFNTQHTCPS